MSDPQWRKQPSPKISTDEGIKIPSNHVSWTALLPICDNLDPDSSVSEMSDSHWGKHSH
jgi:hypothetical protein